MDIHQARTVLGIGPDASMDEAKAAFRMRAKLLHPDRVVGEDEQLRREAEHSMAQLTDAWAVFQRGPVDRDIPSAPAPAPRPPSPNECMLCASSPTAHVVLRRATGMLIVWRRSEINAHLCRDCGLNVFRDTQASNLVRGWWGIFSLFATVYYVLRNLGARNALLRLAPPKPAADSVQRVIPFPLDPGRPVPTRPSVYVATGAAALVVAAVISSSVDSAGTSSRSAACDEHRASVVRALDLVEENQSDSFSVETYALQASDEILANQQCFTQSDIDNARQVEVHYGR